MDGSCNGNYYTGFMSRIMHPSAGIINNMLRCDAGLSIAIDNYFYNVERLECIVIDYTVAQYYCDNVLLTCINM